MNHHPSGGHHLILGQLTDFLTGITLPDTHDERYRQKIARFLIQEKGYGYKDIVPRYDLRASSGRSQALIRLDFLIRLDEYPLMVIKYGPGSLVSRYQIAIAASRLLVPWQVPRAVVTNGETADILDGYTGRVVASGLNGLPSRSELNTIARQTSRVPLDPRRVEQASRIIYTFEVDDRCPCDDDGCTILPTT